jgi:hypothetical protein
MLFISVHVINTAKEIQLVHNVVIYFKPLPFRELKEKGLK